MAARLARKKPAGFERTVGPLRFADKIHQKLHDPHRFGLGSSDGGQGAQQFAAALLEATLPLGVFRAA
jgi:hypothetical protein